MKTLLIGCGSRRQQLIPTRTEENVSFESKDIEGDIVTLDVNMDHNPDIVWDLNTRPLPFEDNTFDQICAFEVLEHLGRQGDYKAFFEEFSEYWRILKPDGILTGTVPHWNSKWAWGDPSHTRVLPLEMFVFLSQKEYEVQIGKTSMSDFRNIYKADFDFVEGVYFGESGYFNLKAKKVV